jgi:uncharacterized protein (TIGR03435 family)
MRNLLWKSMIFAVAASLLHAQPAAPKFEVASIKPCTLDGGPAGGGRQGGGGGASPGDPGMFRSGCLPVRMLIQMAYIVYADGQGPSSSQLKNQPLQGAPDWIDSERYTIDARPASPQTRAMMGGPMLQALLEERFKLKIHRENQEVPAYALLVAKGGPKLKATPEGGCTQGDSRVVQGRPLPCGYMASEQEGTDAVGVKLATLCQILSRQVHRPVIDQTGLTGLYDYHVDFAPGPPGAHPPDDPNAPDPVTNVMGSLQSLGLRLEAAKGTAEFIVIDHIERPSEN